MIAAAIYYIRQFAIFRFLWWVLRNIWPFIVFLCFWQEIDSFMSQFYLWREMMWRLEDFWWALSRNEYFITVSDFVKDAFGWMFGEIRPNVAAIGGWIKGLLS